MDNQDYSGPVRLQRKIPWGKKDFALAGVLFAHMEIVNPPIVIPWTTHQKKVVELLRRHHVHPVNVPELQKMFERVRAFPLRVKWARVHVDRNEAFDLGAGYSQLANDLAGVPYSPAWDASPEIRSAQ